MAAFVELSDEDFPFDDIKLKSVPHQALETE